MYVIRSFAAAAAQQNQDKKTKKMKSFATFGSFCSFGPVFRFWPLEMHGNKRVTSAGQN